MNPLATLPAEKGPAAGLAEPDGGWPEEACLAGRPEEAAPPGLRFVLGALAVRAPGDVDPEYGVPEYGVPEYGVPEYGVPEYGVPE